MSIGPSMPLRLEKPEGIDLAQAARYFGARGGADAATQALLEKCAVPLLAAATPRAVWLEADPDSLTAAGILAGEDVAKHLEGCTAALLLAVTLGPGVDAQIRRAGVGDIAAGVASDALGSALAEQAAEAAEAELRQWAARQGKYLTGRYSPGYGDWPLAVQPLLAAALDTARRAGLCVTENNLMTPRKSITAILGVSDHPVRSGPETGGPPRGAEYHRPGAHREHPCPVRCRRQPHHQCQYLWRFRPQAGGQRVHAGGDHCGGYCQLQAGLRPLRCTGRAGCGPAGGAAGTQRHPCV